MRALLTTRKLVLNKRIDIEMSLRGILRGFGLKIGPTTPRTFEVWARELVDGHAISSRASTHRTSGSPTDGRSG